MTNGHLYAYVMNNYWHTNYLAGQGGDYRLPLRHHQPAEGRQRGLGPLRLGGVQSAARPSWSRPIPRDRCPPQPTSLVSVAEPNVIVIGTKQADEGSGAGGAALGS